MERGRNGPWTVVSASQWQPPRSTLGLDVDTALELLRSHSRSNGINIDDVAARVIDGTLQVNAGALRRADDRDLTS